jgi:hypothetical protein
MKFEFSQEIWKENQITNFIKIHPVGAEWIKKNTKALLLAS